MSECEDGAVENLEEMQLSGGIADNELDRIAGEFSYLKPFLIFQPTYIHVHTSNLQIVHDLAMLHGVDGAAASRQGSVAAADDLILSLNSHRSKRVALLLTDFPVLHWDILFGLNLSILISFLLTSNQSVSEYLSSFQLRFLFAVIVGVFSGTAILCW